jgi:hypothetical protein
MSDATRLIVTALLAWLLGLLTPQIVDTIRRRHDRGRVGKAIATELREIGERLAAGAYYIWSRHGILSTERVEWAASMLEGAQYHPRHNRIARNLRLILEQGPQKLERLNANVAADHQRRNRLIRAKRIETPYLTSVLARLDIFPTGTRQSLLGIDAQIKIYNEIVEECREYGRLTFNESVTGDNRQAVLDNLVQAEIAVATRAHFIVELVKSLDLNSEAAVPAEILNEPPTIEETDTGGLL